MNRWIGQVAVVTGASAGIGAAITEKLLDHGVKVVGLARRKEKLVKLQEKFQEKRGMFYHCVTDVGREEDIVKAFKWIKENVGVASILVNNAGVSRLSSLIEGNSEHMKDVINTNVFGLCYATREAIRDMQANNVDGHIIHINSIAGHKVIRSPINNMYAASKHAVTALTEGLRNELSLMDSKIKVTSISPGTVRTEIINSALEKNTAPGHEKLAKAMKEYVDSAPSLQPVDIAEAAIFVLSTPPHVQVHELMIKPIGEQF